jgi:hypothetical protein
MSRLVKRIVLGASAAVLVLACLGGAALWWLSREGTDLPVSAESGRQYFRYVGFGFPYETGIPYALAVAALRRYPEELGGDRDEFCQKFGAIIDPDNRVGLPIGFVRHHDRLSGTEFLTTNCSLCHTAMIDGRTVAGLGNRNLRLNAMNLAIMRIAARTDFNAANMIPAAEACARERKIPWGTRAAFVTELAIKELKELAMRSKADAWEGLNGADAGPGRNTPIEFAKATSGVPVEPPFGLVKLPAVWTHGFRETFGYDGSLKGDMAYALAAVEFNKKMSSAHIFQREARWQSVYEYLKILEPPKYPGKIDAELARKGRELFRENCSHCHGAYGPDRPVKYHEKIVPLAEIGTDPDRLRAISGPLLEARRKGAFARKVQLVRTDGYVVPPLIGIWCRGPYLHNGSVPTLSDMLRPADERPTSFFNGGDTGYDLDRVGLPYEEETHADGQRTGRRTSASQFPFSTKDPGNSNSGHEFGVDLAAEERRALLEYLKQL